jgi:cadmium resistance protein CadD (predicted permease)
MRRTLLGLLIVLPLTQGLSFAQRKDCEELKKEIAVKMDANGVKNYTLTVTDVKDVKETDKVVGGCDGGSRKIVYTRG